MTYISHELTEREYNYLWTQGMTAIIDYGWLRVLEQPWKEDHDSWYKGAFLKEKDGKFYIICKVDKDDDEDEDDLK